MWASMQKAARLDSKNDPVSRCVQAQAPYSFGRPPGRLLSLLLKGHDMKQTGEGPGAASNAERPYGLVSATAPVAWLRVAASENQRK